MSGFEAGFAFAQWGKAILLQLGSGLLFGRTIFLISWSGLAHGRLALAGFRLLGGQQWMCRFGA